jgi:hypothetical protein
MANTQGSLENPFCIDDIEPSRTPRANNGKAKAYYELHEDRPPTELPVDAIPSNSRARDKGKSRRDSNNVTSDHASTSRRSSNFTANRTPRTPAKPGAGDEVITIDDDEPPTCFTPRSKSSTMSGDAKAVVPSGSGTYAMSRTPSLPVTSPHFASTTVEKESSIPPPSRLAYLLANNPAQSRKTSVVPPASACLAEPWRDPAPLPRRNDYLGNSNKTPPQDVISAPVDMTDQRPLGPTIGIQPDTGRKQIASRHVETNATSIPARVNDVNEGSDTSSAPKVPDRARKTADATAFRLPSKPRAIKTASSAPWQKSGSARSDHKSTRNHALPPSSEPISKEESHSEPVSRPVSRRRRVEDSPTVTSNDSPSYQEENLKLDPITPDQELSASPPGSVLTPLDVDSAALGAHVSTSTVIPLPLVSSEKDTTRDNESAISAQSPQSNPIGLSSRDANAAAITQEPPEPIEHADRLGRYICKAHKPGLVAPEAPRNKQLNLEILTDFVVSLNELHKDAERDIVAARRKIEVTLRHHLDERYEEHAYLVKV